MRPTAEGERIVAVDVLRGAALFGVLLVNLVEDFRVSLFEYLRVFHTHPGTANRVTDLAIAFFFEQKAMVIFSLLFGVGLELQRARQGPRPERFLLRRYTLLLVIGLAHLLLVWNGDILTEYAIAGLIVIPLLSLPPAATGAIGLGLVAWWASPWPPPSLPFPSEAVEAGLAAGAAEAYGRGGLAAIHAFRLHELTIGIAPLLTAVMPRTIGLFLTGAAIARAGWVTRPPRATRAAAPFALLAGGVLTGLDVLTAEGLADLGALRAPIGSSGVVLLAFGYVGAFALLGPKAIARLGFLAPIGRMALTNYLTQTVLAVALFYGIGLGLMNRLGSFAAFVLAAAIFALQALLSARWLARRPHGPVEAIWRRLSYGPGQG